MRAGCVLAAALLAVVTAAGCGDDAGPAAFDTRALEDQHRVWFAQAAEMWNAAAGVRLFTVDDAGRDRAEYRPADPLSTLKARVDCAGGACVIGYADTWNWTACSDAAGDADFLTATLHELWHMLFGSSHSTHPDSIGQAHVSNCTRLSDHDVSAVRGLVQP